MNPKVKKGIKIASDVLFWFFFVVALGLSVLSFASGSGAAGYPKFGNKALFAIQSESMEKSEYEDGGFKKGDMIISTILKMEERDNLKKGDVITYIVTDPNSPIFDQLCTHRIVEDPVIGEGFVVYQTKGDNPSDQVVVNIRSGDVQAVWTGKKIAGLGGIVTFLNKPYGFWPCVVLPLCGFLGYEIYVLVGEIKKATGHEKRKITKADEELIKKQAVEEFLKKQAEEQSAGNNTNDK